MTLKDKIIIVTGASAGIGLGITKAALNVGAIVYAFNRSEDRFADLEKLGAIPVAVDVSDPVQFSKAIDEVTMQEGRLDGIVNNAGATLTAPFLEADLAMWDQLWITNQRSVLVGCQSAARNMVAYKTRGSIVNISSVHAHASDVSYEGYAGTKGAIVAMGRSMAWSLGEHGIRVNTLSPGLTMTESVAKVAKDETVNNIFKSWHADQTIPTVEEVAQIAVFLLSDASIVLNGTEIIADKGTCARLCSVGTT